MNPKSRARAGLLIGSLLIAAVAYGIAAAAAGAAPAAAAPASAAPPASATPPAATAPAASAAPSAAATPPCEACHGAHGEGMAPAHVPRLAGQAADYLLKQLDDYADGTRDNPIMRNFSRALRPRQRAEYAARYASLSAPYLAQTTSPNSLSLARGHQLAFQGDEARRVQACNGCHGPDGMGVLHAAPYLAGQSAEYLAAELKAFQSGTRKNDAGEAMRSVAQRLNDADVAAVAAYFASQGQPHADSVTLSRP